MYLIKHELKQNKKTFVIWSICIAICCAGCILLYESLEDSLMDMANAYSNLGAMSVALGMDKLSLATMMGYYGTEISMIFNLGSAIFVAMLGIAYVSKEEYGHTSEFINTFPISRNKIYTSKYLSLFIIVICYNIIQVLINYVSLLAVNSTFDLKPFALYHIASFIMQIEISTLCFMISAINKKTLTGLGIGITILFYIIDMMCRIIPSIENAKYITPFYYCSAADIFTSNELNAPMIITGIIVSVICFVVGETVYYKKDIAA